MLKVYNIIIKLATLRKDEWQVMFAIETYCHTTIYDGTNGMQKQQRYPTQLK